MEKALKGCPGRSSSKDEGAMKIIIIVVVVVVVVAAAIAAAKAVHARSSGAAVPRVKATQVAPDVVVTPLTPSKADAHTPCLLEDA